ncbi:MAG: hypothetical protein KGL95_16190 [Patescibacteria group bacterium]|nr:hypothetical protein [Patescibacteria group bacterium]
MRISLDPPYLSYQTGSSPPPFFSTATITVHVTDQSGNPVSSASVAISVKSPSGSTTTHSGSTNTSGVLSYNYAIGKHAQTGSYSVTATATKSGYISGSANTTFIVSSVVGR